MSTNPSSQKNLTPPKSITFLFEGLSGLGATCFVQPLELLKNRMQLRAVTEKSSSMQAALKIFKSEGIFGMYNGLSAGLLRQATYTTTRLGVYNILLDRATKEKKVLPFYQKALIGMTAGGIGALIGNPAEIVLVRMTADGRLPPEQRRCYKNAFQALYRIWGEEGLLRLWRGSTPTVLRAMVLNAAQLATYSQSKQVLLNSGWFKDNITCHFFASMSSGFFSTVVSMPIDIAKTRIQNMKGQEYKNVLDVWVKIIQNEGFFSLWKGFTPYYFRLGPHTVFTFIILEQLNQAYARFKLRRINGSNPV